MLKHLTRRLHGVLAPLGFARVGTTWRRNHTIAFDVVGIAQARFSSGVTVGLGVYFKNLGNDTNPVAECCHLRTRLQGGALDAYAQEFDESEEQVAGIATALAATAPAWFEAMKTRSGALAAMVRDAESASPQLLDAITYGSIRLA
jgi:hypothetical protein